MVYTVIIIFLNILRSVACSNNLKTYSIAQNQLETHQRNPSINASIIRHNSTYGWDSKQTIIPANDCMQSMMHQSSSMKRAILWDRASGSDLANMETRRRTFCQVLQFDWLIFCFCLIWIWTSETWKWLMMFLVTFVLSITFCQLFWFLFQSSKELLFFSINGHHTNM